MNLFLTKFAPHNNKLKNMNEIVFKRPTKLAGFPMFLEGISQKSEISENLIKLTFANATPNPDDIPELTLTPLSELSTDRKRFKIISVTERLAPFDRLLVGPNHLKKSLPELTKILHPHAVDKRSLLQWKSISADSGIGSIIQNYPHLSSLKGSKSEAVILPWWVDPTIFLSADWGIHELHPAEFTPSAGSGCWAVTAEVGDDISQTDLLKQIHHPATVVLTNAERKFKRDFEIKGVELLGNFIDRPLDDKYHLYICVRRESDDSIHYIDYPCSALGDLFEELKDEIESIVK